MDWNRYRQELATGESVSFRPKGNSMVPRIHSGQQVTVSPDVGELEKDEVVFCKVNGTYYVHLVSAVQGDRIQISNNKGHVNGWITKSNVFGKVIQVQD